MRPGLMRPPSFDTFLSVMFNGASETVFVSPLAVRLISTVLPSETANASPSKLTQRQIPALRH
jgi:hypothetical protein